jgi:cytochrome c-type biogenesis protein CcmH
MIVFWVIGAALAAAALVLVLRPLLFTKKEAQLSRGEANVSIYRDQLRELDADLASGMLAQADYERARTELEARVLQDVVVEESAAPRRRSALSLTVTLALAVPLCAAALYIAVGNPSAIDSPAVHLQTMVERLAAHLRENPDDSVGWKLLGRAYASLERFPEAADAYAKAAVRAPRDAQLLADFAEALAMARGRSLEGEPEQLLARALELEPQNLKALALAGTAAFARKDYAAAAARWEKMLPLVAADSEEARSIQASVDEAKSLMEKRELKGTVSLSAKLKARAAPEDTVFIFARAAEGPPMPLAVLRKQVRDLPLAFSLDDSMAMAPGMRLSGFPRVIVAARVSKSGEAAPRPGDLQGSSPPVANDAEGVNVVIDGVVP